MKKDNTEDSFMPVEALNASRNRDANKLQDEDVQQ